MKINLQVVFEGGVTKEVVCNAADLVAFEDKFDVSIATISAETRLSHLLFLTWHSEKRTGGTKDTFDKWLESVESVGDSGIDPK
jgi:hypothetical protein